MPSNSNQVIAASATRSGGSSQIVIFQKRALGRFPVICFPHLHARRADDSADIPPAPRGPCCKVYDSVIAAISLASSSPAIAGSTKKTTGNSLRSPGSSSCSVKQKHWILLKYLPVSNGVTLKVAVPRI